MKKIDFETSIKNLKRNWYFPISAMAFFFLSFTVTMGFLTGFLLAFLISLIAATQIPSIWDYIKKNPVPVQIVSSLTAAGICWGGQVVFYAELSTSSKAKTLKALLPFSIDLPSFMSIFGAIAGFLFVYVCVLMFYKELNRIFTENHTFSGMHTGELVIYTVLIILSLIFVTIAFTQTDAFYGTKYSYDIIYTSDSPALIKGNIYFALTHQENDLRQPLFAVFAAPFMGIPYFIGKLFNVSASLQAMLMNYVQIIMLFAANYMLTKMMKLTPLKRVCFMLLTCCTYTHLLFSLMMEQYIVAYFWLIFCIYLICEKKQPERIALWGAGGTLLTSMILLPFMSEKSPLKNFKEWFTDMIKYGLEFVVVILAFCRFDVIFNFASRVSFLSTFTGEKVTFMDKLYQYTTFLKNCFLAPDAAVDAATVGHVSWQLKTITEINVAGIVILLLVIISAILNRQKKSSLLAAGWTGFSILMLLGLGWGTNENGLILYALYFGWAFLVLLFQLIEYLENKWKNHFLIPAISIVSIIILGAVNIPAIIEIINFGITYFPV